MNILKKISWKENSGQYIFWSVILLIYIGIFKPIQNYYSPITIFFIINTFAYNYANSFDRKQSIGIRQILYTSDLSRRKHIEERYKKLFLLSLLCLIIVTLLFFLNKEKNWDEFYLLIFLSFMIPYLQGLVCIYLSTRGLSMLNISIYFLTRIFFNISYNFALMEGSVLNILLLNPHKKEPYFCLFFSCIFIVIVFVLSKISIHRTLKLEIDREF